LRRTPTGNSNCCILTITNDSWQVLSANCDRNHGRQFLPLPARLKPPGDENLTSEACQNLTRLKIFVSDLA
jgi:hypothetical protein